MPPKRKLGASREEPKPKRRRYLPPLGDELDDVVPAEAAAGEMNDADLLQRLIAARYLIAAGLIEGRLQAWFAILSDPTEKVACPQFVATFSSELKQVFKQVDMGRDLTQQASVADLFKQAILGIPVGQLDNTHASPVLARQDTGMPQRALVHHQSRHEANIPGVLPALPEKQQEALRLLREFLSQFPAVKSFFKRRIDLIKDVAECYRRDVVSRYPQKVPPSPTPEINSGDTESEGPPDDEQEAALSVGFVFGGGASAAAHKPPPKPPGGGEAAGSLLGKSS